MNREIEDMDVDFGVDVFVVWVVEKYDIYGNLIEEFEDFGGSIGEEVC